MKLSKKVALVTGASRGIGRAIASVLAHQGAHVIGTATTLQGAAAIEAFLAPLAGRGVMLNVDDQAAIDAVVGSIQKDFGSLDILVNNAGITRDTLVMRMKDEDWQSVVDTDLTAVFRTSRAVLRGMLKAKGGRIVNITSVVGSTGNPGQVNYAAAKAGVAGMTRALAREVGSRGITVNCVAPGFIDTDMTKELSAEQVQSLTGQIPLGRLGQPDDIAQAVLFLVSEEASYITGTTLHVNGGMYLN